MTDTASIRFELRSRAEVGGAIAIVPAINEALLTDLIHAFEGAHNYGPSDAYGGLITGFYQWGPLDTHFLGQSRALEEPQRVPLLGCECGEWGCWPLFARVHVTGPVVQWTGFEQPFRPDRDYSGFGPFWFERTEYSRALAQLVTTVDSVSQQASNGRMVDRG